MKKCVICNKEKKLSDFYFNGKWYRGDCKKCHNIYVTNLIKNDRKKNPCKYILKSIKQRCTNQNQECYKYYGGRGIKCLITEEELKKLWKRDNASKMICPSIDRIENNGNYTVDNCRFIEHIDNIKRMNSTRQKDLLQFDLKGTLIKEWKSIKEVKEILKIFVHLERKKSGGFIWKYKENKC
jgi:hypothetical protein